jgi:hypothetical protein
MMPEARDRINSTDSTTSANSDTTISDAGSINSSTPKRRQKTILKPYQVRVLTSVMEQTAFPSTTLRNELAKSLNIDERAVRIWFQNQRQRTRNKLGRNNADRGQSREVLLDLQGLIQDSIRPPFNIHGSSKSPAVIMPAPSVVCSPQNYHLGPHPTWQHNKYQPSRHARTRSDISPQVNAAVRDEILRRQQRSLYYRTMTPQYGNFYYHQPLPPILTTSPTSPSASPYQYYYLPPLPESEFQNIDRNTIYPDFGRL